MSYPMTNDRADVRVIGRVGSIRTNTVNNKPVANVSIAFQRSWPKRENGQTVEGQFDHQTGWVEFAAWDHAATKVSEQGIEVGDIVEVSYSMADMTASAYVKDNESKASVKCSRSTIILIAKKGEKTEAPSAEETI
jgi:hypothetical protein